MFNINSIHHNPFNRPHRNSQCGTGNRHKLSFHQLLLKPPNNIRSEMRILDILGRSYSTLGDISLSKVQFQRCLHHLFRTNSHKSLLRLLAYFPTHCLLSHIHNN